MKSNSGNFTEGDVTMQSTDLEINGLLICLKERVELYRGIVSLLDCS